MSTINLKGLYGKTYQFFVFNKDAKFNDVSAIYAFTKQHWDGRYEILYIGQTTKLKSRLSNHEKWDAVNRRGCNIILAAQFYPSELDAVEADLIGYYQPPCNTLLKP